MQVSRAGLYAWRKRSQCRRRIDNEKLVLKIKAIFNASRQTYGSPRVHRELLAQGVDAGLNRVARLMRENDLCVKPRRGFRCATQSDPSHPVAPDRLRRDFTASSPNEKWVGDVTFIRNHQGWLYLAILVDLYNREVVGWAMGTRNDQDLTLQALDMAVTRHGAPAGLIHHSDRGSNYTGARSRRRLKRYGMVRSMSRVGDCWDNAVAESFFATLKKGGCLNKCVSARDSY